MTKPKPKETELEKAVARIKPAHTAYILRLLRKSWPGDEIELVKANYSLKGIKAIIRDKNDNQEYVMEIYPNA